MCEEERVATLQRSGLHREQESRFLSLGHNAHGETFVWIFRPPAALSPILVIPHPFLQERSLKPSQSYRHFASSSSPSLQSSSSVFFKDSSSFIRSFAFCTLDSSSDTEQGSTHGYSGQHHS